jgi:hypothetical protein
VPEVFERWDIDPATAAVLRAAGVEPNPFCRYAVAPPGPPYAPPVPVNPITPRRAADREQRRVACALEYEQWRRDNVPA